MLKTSSRYGAPATARQRQTPWARALAAAVGLALVAGCGGNPADWNAAVEVSPTQVTVRQGETGQVQVDASGLGAGEVLSGYSIDLPEVLADIDITTAACNSGGPNCQTWTVRPGGEALRGNYRIQVDATWAGLALQPAQFTLAVEPDGALMPPAVAVATDWPSDRLMFSDAGGVVWGMGINVQAEVDVGYLDGRGGVQPSIITAPSRLRGGTAQGRPVAVSAFGAALDDAGVLSTWGRLRPDLSALPGLVDSARAAGPALAVLDRSGRLWAAFEGGAFQPVDLGGRAVLEWHAMVARSDGSGLYLLRLADGTVAWLVPGLTVGDAPALLPLAELRGSTELAVGRCTSLHERDPDLFVLGQPGCGHVLARMPDGRVLTAGQAAAGALGVAGATTAPCRADGCATRAPVLPAPAVAIAAGNGRSFALLADGRLMAWGQWPRAGGGFHQHPEPVTVDAQALPAAQRLTQLTAGAAIDDCAAELGGRVWLVDGSGTLPVLSWLTNTGCALETAQGGTAPSASSHSLSIDIGGAGAVRVIPAEQVCRGSCNLSLAAGSVVTLAPQADAGWQLLSLNGDAGCQQRQLTMDRDLRCIATFVLADAPSYETATLTVARAGSGAAQGLVHYEGSGVTCPQDCSYGVSPGERFRLVAETALPGVRFVRWDGCDAVEDAIAGAGDRCLVTVDSDRTVTAVFELQ